MFPTPIGKARPATRLLDRLGLPTALIVWLPPLIAVMQTLTFNRGPEAVTLDNGQVVEPQGIAW